MEVAVNMDDALSREDMEKNRSFLMTPLEQLWMWGRIY
jgi:hypothetical protein